VDEAAAVELAVGVYDELTRVAPERLAPALLLHGAAAPGPQTRRAHLRAERLPARDAVLLELVPGAAGWATRHAQLRAAGRRAGGEGGRLRPPAGAARHPAIAVGAASDDALDLALGIVDALDADLAG
jgi:hypothetical protein